MTIKTYAALRIGNHRMPSMIPAGERAWAFHLLTNGATSDGGPAVEPEFQTAPAQDRGVPGEVGEAGISSPAASVSGFPGFLPNPSYLYRQIWQATLPMKAALIAGLLAIGMVWTQSAFRFHLPGIAEKARKTSPYGQPTHARPQGRRAGQQRPASVLSSPVQGARRNDAG